jgi:uncharacterized membrane protein YgcG
MPVTIAGTSNLVLQSVNSQTGAVATGSTTIPLDDTIPQNTEGTEFLTASITPTKSTSKLLIQVVIVLSASTGNQFLACALFQDSTANALAVTNTYNNQATGTSQLTLNYYMTAGTTSSTTFKVRAGGSSAGTFTLNGTGGGRSYGGAMASSITITELNA